MYIIDEKDSVALVKPGIDVHTLGLAAASDLLTKIGVENFISNKEISNKIEHIEQGSNLEDIDRWLRFNNIKHIGYSYRLSPDDGVYFFEKFYKALKKYKLLYEDGGYIKNIFFAGLPETAHKIKELFLDRIIIFTGDEDNVESLVKMGVDKRKIPKNISMKSKYDEERFNLAKSIITNEEYKLFNPIDRSEYKNYGTFIDTLIGRIKHSVNNDLPPLIRVHVGPYSSIEDEAKKEFNEWLRILAKAGYLDIVSVGTSQLSQSNFGEVWGDKANGGGVPVNSEEDYYDIWSSSRPMLVRTYSGTKNVLKLANIYEKNINMAWHALSFWWFCNIDGRGNNTVIDNLREHFETVSYIGSVGKPFEANVPHHFAFRGSDDISYVVSAYLAAKAAKKYGIKDYVQQFMLNTPKGTYGVQDLAKCRAILSLLRTLEDKDFKVYVQPRVGLDYFSSDINKAKIQLATATMMMDDIEPLNINSPNIIHVVSYCEAVHLANPSIINDSIKITQYSLEEYRRCKKMNLINNMVYDQEVDMRHKSLLEDAKKLIEYAEKSIVDLYTPEGFYSVFEKGLFPVPYLWEGREEFSKAVNWNTGLIDGAVRIINDKKEVIKIDERIGILKALNNEL